MASDLGKDHVPMTPAELAEMLNGLPEGARPRRLRTHWGGDSLNPIYPGEWFAWFENRPGELVTREQVVPIDYATDLACMAGLRHMRTVPSRNINHNAPVQVGFWENADSTWTVCVKWSQLSPPGMPRDKSEWLEYTGPTILHAIDKAVRAVAERKP